MHSGHTSRPLPARKVYYDWDDLSTNPDFRLVEAFETTQPGVIVDPIETESADITLPGWVIPGVGALIVGFFVGKWWLGRDKKGATTTVAGQDVFADPEQCGFSLLGAE